MSFMNNLHSKRCRVYFEDQWGIWGGQWNDQIYALGSCSGRSIFQYRKVLENYIYQKLFTIFLFFWLIQANSFGMIHVLDMYKKYITFLLLSYSFQICPYVSPWIDLVQIVETFVWVAYNSDDPFGVIYDRCSFI